MNTQETAHRSILHPEIRFIADPPFSSLDFSFPRFGIVERIRKTFSHHQRGKPSLLHGAHCIGIGTRYPLNLEPMNPVLLYIVRLLLVQRLTNRSSSVNSSVMPRATGTWLGFLIRDNPSLLGESHELGAFAKKISFRLFVDRFLPPPLRITRRRQFDFDRTEQRVQELLSLEFDIVEFCISKKKKKKKGRGGIFSPLRIRSWNGFLVLKRKRKFSWIFSSIKLIGDNSSRTSITLFLQIWILYFKKKKKKKKLFDKNEEEFNRIFPPLRIRSLGSWY